MDAEFYAEKYGRQHLELIRTALAMLADKPWAGAGFDVDLYLLHLLPRPSVRFRLVDGRLVDPVLVEPKGAGLLRAYVPAASAAVDGVLIDGVAYDLPDPDTPWIDLAVRTLRPIEAAFGHAPAEDQAEAQGPRPNGPPTPETLPPSPDSVNADRAFYLSMYRVQTERLSVLVAFLANPVVAPRDADDYYDPDVVSAYNAALETTLKHVRALVLSEHAKPTGDRP